MQQTPTPSGPRALNPSPNAPKKKTPMNPRMLIGVGVAALVLVAAIVAAVIVTRQPREPALNADSITILKFAGSEQFAKLPFDRQVIHMKLIDEREKELKDAYEAGGINEQQLRLAKELAWFGKQLDRMNEYYARPNQQQRQAYLDRLIQKDEKKDAEDEKKEKEKPKRTADPNERKSGDVQRDQLSEEIRPLTWPKDAQSKWTAYRTHLRERKEALKPPETSAAANK